MIQSAQKLKLHAVSELINQVVDDAMVDLVLVEAILVDENMTLSDWDSQYTDLPNALAKVKVSLGYNLWL